MTQQNIGKLAAKGALTFTLLFVHFTGKLDKVTIEVAQERK